MSEPGWTREMGDIIFDAFVAGYLLDRRPGPRSDPELIRIGYRVVAADDEPRIRRLLLDDFQTWARARRDARV